jgi:hypothetical protein
MRSSSIKTFVAILSLTLTLAAAAPRAEARPSQPTRSTATAMDRIQRSVQQLMTRFFGISFTSNALPTDPIPLSDPEFGKNTMTSPKTQR